MQRKLIVVAVTSALGIPAAGLAQNATVSIYGRFYAEYAKVFQGNQNAAPFNQPLVDVDFLQAPGSNIGFRGEEKLGGGMSAWFQCESSYDFRGQNQDGLCARNSALGLKGGFGNLFVGVWDTPFKRVQDAVGGRDTAVFGTAFILMGASTTTGSAITNQAVFRRRQVNSINYDTPNFGGFQLSGAYTNLNTQTNVVNSATGSKPRVWSLSAKYANGPINIYGAYETHKDIVPGTSNDDSGWVVGATYTFANSLKIGGIYSRQKFDTSPVQAGRVNTWHLGVDWKISGPHGLRASWTAAGDVKGNSAAIGATRPAAGGDTGADLWQIRYVHTLSKRTELTAGYVKLKNDANARYQLGGLNNNQAGNDPSAIAIALDHRF